MSEAKVTGVSLKVTDLGDALFRMYSEKGSPSTGMPPHCLTAELSGTFSVQGGEPPTSIYKVREAAIRQRLEQRAADYIDEQHPGAEMRAARQRQEQIRADIRRAESEQARLRRKAQAALAERDEAQAAKCERDVLALGERIANLKAVAIDLAGTPQTIRECNARALSEVLHQERECIHQEILERRAELLRQLADVAPLLVELWVLQESALLTRSLTATQLATTVAPLYTLIERLSDDSAARAGARTVAEWNVPKPDGFPPGASMDGPVPSSRDVAEAMGGYTPADNTVR